MKQTKLSVTLITICLLLSGLINITACKNQESSEQVFIPIKPSPAGDDPNDDSKNYGDVLRDENSVIYGILNDKSLTAVTKEYGYTVINEKVLPLRSEVALAEIKPWSSWWFPKIDRDLFEDGQQGELSTLAKYDLFRQSRKPGSGSAAEYEKKMHNPMSSHWEGLCDAWSLAAIAYPEPRKPVRLRLDGPHPRIIEFSIADLKALLLKTFEAIDDNNLRYFGQKFSGNISGWIYPDIFPEQFHRLIEIQLFQNKKPIIMDHDPGAQIWSVPVYKANYRMEKIVGQPNAVFVRTWLYSAESSQRSEKNFVGTKESSREYNYVLEGKRLSNGDLEIHTGYWVKGPDGIDSRKDHPDYFIQMQDPTKVLRKSWNPEIEIDLIDAILKESIR